MDHRLTRSDGTTVETPPRPVRPGQFCTAGISEHMARRHDPGATVVHLVRPSGGEWAVR